MPSPDYPILWLTRPFEHASSLCHALAGMNINILHAPLYHYQYQPLPKDMMDDITNSQHIMITSQAIFHHPNIEYYRDLLIQKPLYVVGDKTASYAADFGFKDIYVAKGNGESLATLYQQHHGLASSHQAACKKYKLLYLTGTPRKPLIENLFTMHKYVDFKSITLYQSHYIHTLPFFIRQQYEAQRLNAITLFSQETVLCVHHLIRILPKKHKLNFFCFSPSIAEQIKRLEGEAYGNIHIAKKPTIAALVEDIKSVYSRL